MTPEPRGPTPGPKLSRWSRVRADGTLEPVPDAVSPTPWRIVHHDRDRHAATIHADDCTIVCVVDSGDADAALLAAAPDLAQSLRDVLRQFVPGRDKMTAEGRATYDRARAALAKAKAGGS